MGMVYKFIKFEDTDIYVFRILVLYAIKEA